MTLEGRSSRPLAARVGFELYDTNAIPTGWNGTNTGQPTYDNKDTGTHLPGEIEARPAGRRRSRRAKASCIRGRSLPRASGIQSGIPRMAAFCGRSCTRQSASLVSPFGWGNDHARVRTNDHVRQSIGGRVCASVTGLTGWCDTGHRGRKAAPPQARAWGLNDGFGRAAQASARREIAGWRDSCLAGRQASLRSECQTFKEGPKIVFAFSSPLMLGCPPGSGKGRGKTTLGPESTLW